MLNIRQQKELKKKIQYISKTNNSYKRISYTFKSTLKDLSIFASNKFFKNKHQFFWEDCKSDILFSTYGCIDKIEINHSSDLDKGGNRINLILNKITDISTNKHAGPKFFGGYSFDINSKVNKNWNGFPRGYFILPEFILTKNKKGVWITIIKKINLKLNAKKNYNNFLSTYNELIHKVPSKKLIDQKIIITKNKNLMDKKEYKETVKKIINKIKSNELEKLVFSRSKYIEFNHTFNITKSLDVLRKKYPKCINFFFKIPKKGIFFGSTPERLISKNKNQIKTEAIAGTIKRGRNKKEDTKLGEELISNKKNCQEHKIVIKEIKNILHLKLTDMKITKIPNLLKLNNVQHLISKLSGNLIHDTHILSLVKILHPTPAVAGTPRNKAIKLINDYETHDRGWYSGPLGWIDKDGNGDFCVALRSGLVIKKTVQIFSGGGILKNSLPEEEWEETKIKLEPMLSAIKEI